MRAKNFFISFPRSGRQWTKRRIKAILSERGVEPNDKVTFSHFGYNPMTPRNPGFQKHIENLNVTVLLRDPRGLLASYFHFYNEQAAVEAGHTPAKNPMEFIRGDYGLSRLCAFLADVHNVVEKDKARKNVRVNYVFYEDLFDVQAVAAMLPAVMGFGKGLSDEEAHILDEHASTDRDGQISKYKRTLDARAIATINETMERDCALDVYRDRYLGAKP